jgi:hypothetical protein
MRYLYDIMDIPHQLPELEKLDNLHMRHQPIISYWKGGYIFFLIVIHEKLCAC